MSLSSIILTTLEDRNKIPNKYTQTHWHDTESSSSFVLQENLKVEIILKPQGTEMLPHGNIVS